MRRTASLVAAFCSVLAAATVAAAGTFTVTPVRVSLSETAKSGLLTLRNTSSEPLRFQLSVRAWDQRSDGELVLSPTRDIVFFPQLLTLAPGDERRIRVGAATTYGTVEKTYRLFIEELPPQDDPQRGAAAGQIVFRTKLGIPIFLRPAKAAPLETVGDLRLERHHFSFEVRNNGTAHFLPSAIRVLGRTASGETLFETDLKAWYVLAGGTRVYRVEIGKEDCPRLTQVVVEVESGGRTIRETLTGTRDGCVE